MDLDAIHRQHRDLKQQVADLTKFRDDVMALTGGPDMFAEAVGKARARLARDEADEKAAQERQDTPGAATQS